MVRNGPRVPSTIILVIPAVVSDKQGVCYCSRYISRCVLPQFYSYFRYHQIGKLTAVFWHGSPLYTALESYK